MATWRLAFGAVDGITESVIWRDDQLAIIYNDRKADCNQSPFTISPSQRFVLIGDVWLPDRSSLMQQMDIDWSASETQETALFDRYLVAQLWERDGIATCAKLSGAFALAVWDREQRRLWLGRDRSGIRTLYYTTDGITRWVAPQLRAIEPYSATELDLVALRDYLCCAFVPGERTLWQQVREVRPGNSVELPDGIPQPYWHLQEHITHPDQPLEWHGDRLRSLLEQVVQEYLPSGAPVGAFLSGGLDSSCITALAAKHHDAPLHTYSIHFGADCPNELEFSSLVAQHCQTEHHILEITFKEMWEHLPETMAALDDPIGDPLTVPNLLLGRLAADSVQTVLNGEGGDPCFGGPKNQPMLINALYGNALDRDRNSSVAQQHSLQAYLTSFQKCAADLPQLLKPEIWAALQSKPSVFAPVLQSNDRYLNRLMALNITFKGADQILTKVHNLTRAAGIDGRSPLFDPRVVELSMTIPPDYKLSGVQEKAVLKQAVADLLPETIIHRPKSGMMVPVQLGFREHWNRQARSLLLSRDAAIAPYLNQTLIRNWLNYNGDTWGRYGVKLWLLVSLEYWLQARQ
ncbi:asparagine synthase [Stenomitos frigidus ULC18]|uniref:asparagine synthase (glutamine-hydrolyzing) n=1 Tax=Stenomitos frigidus ULC18 TaxID=2107698 RepID=A0A2T1E2C7_9CYAN|nr:asparagine synthase [Stenomitos frigidus ULC18]